MKNYRLAIVLTFVVLLMGIGILAAATKPAPDTVVLKGAPMGGVKFNHKVHAAVGQCTTCHHASKPEKALASEHQACMDCHTKVATAPMKTKTQAAFHNPTAAAGLCIDCHKTDASAKAKSAPTKCADCHKKDNA